MALLIFLFFISVNIMPTFMLSRLNIDICGGFFNLIILHGQEGENK